MNAHISDFLERVRPFLVAANEVDVLRENGSSVEDRAAGMAGGMTEENLQAAVGAMGDPRDVAAAWSTARPAVAANYRKIHWLLAGLLYAVTVGMAVISAITGGATFVGPFVYIPSLTPLTLLCYLPFAFVFDYGLASLLIQVNERLGTRVGVEWVRHIAHRDPRRGRPTLGRVIGELAGVAGMVVLYLFARFGIPHVVSLPGPMQLMKIPFFIPFAVCELALVTAEFTVTFLHYARDWPAFAIIKPLAGMVALLIAATIVRTSAQPGLADLTLRGVLVVTVLIKTWDLVQGVATAFFAWNAAPRM
jgi:hypothetical protein